MEMPGFPLNIVEEGMKRLRREHAGMATLCKARSFVPGEDPEETPFTKAVGNVLVRGAPASLRF